MTTNLYETAAAQRDIAYRGWITEVNYTSMMLRGGGIYDDLNATPQRMRRWYLAGLDAYTVVKRLNGAR